MFRSGPERSRICFILSPTGRNGGGMGRVKDYILQSARDSQQGLRFVAIDTRGTHGAALSVFFTAYAIARVIANAIAGRVAFVHVNVGHRGSFVRKAFAILALRAAGIKVIMHLHAGALMQDYARYGRTIRALMRMPFHAATCCVVLGQSWRTWLVGTIGVDPRKVEVVYNGVPLDTAARVVGPSHPGGCHRLLFLGNLLETKGLPELLRAVARLPATVGEWRLTVAGAGDAERWRAEADGLGIADRVTFPGWVDQAGVRRLLSESDVLLLPSHEEVLPLVVLEALGTGTPVLCTPVGVIPELLEDMRTAVFVRPRDATDLCHKLQHLLNDPELLRTLAGNGRTLFAQRFTLAAFTRNLFAVYRRHCGIEIAKPGRQPLRARVPVGKG